MENEERTCKNCAHAHYAYIGVGEELMAQGVNAFYYCDKEFLIRPDSYSCDDFEKRPPPSLRERTSEEFWSIPETRIEEGALVCIWPDQILKVREKEGFPEMEIIKEREGVGSSYEPRYHIAIAMAVLEGILSEEAARKWPIYLDEVIGWIKEQRKSSQG